MSRIAHDLIIAAARALNLDDLSCALHAGACPNTVDDHYGWSVLIWVCKQNQLGPDAAECLRTLLQSGADPNFVGVGGLTALSAVCEDARDDLARILLDAGAMIQPTVTSENALVSAVFGTSLTLVQLLIDAGADPASSDYRGSALDVADRLKNAELAALLQRSARH